MTNLREAVARAISDAEWGGTQHWDRKPESFRNRYCEYADAAIAAVLEEMMENPSEGMGAAGLDVLEDGQSWLAALRVHRAIVAQFRKEALNGH